MALATLQWDPHSGSPGDGSSGNAGPALLSLIGTEANPKKQMRYAAFDATTPEHLWFQFRMPADFKEKLVIKLLWMTNAASANKVVWGAKIGAVTPADADTPVEHASSETVTVTTEGNATEARRLIESKIEPKEDSVAAGDWVEMLIRREAENANDTSTIDAELLSIALEYTTT